MFFDKFSAVSALISKSGSRKRGYMFCKNDKYEIIKLSFMINIGYNIKEREYRKGGIFSINSFLVVF